MATPLDRAVVVVTGASSGIGRAAALRFAARGSRLALCARNREPLEQVAELCRARGAEVLAESVDVCEGDRVEKFAAATTERFGGLDVWVNGAAVMAYGRFEDVPPEVFRRVIETNLIGQANGARAALKRFREQGSGVLITMSSVWGRVSTPEVGAYVASKNAVRALSECIYHELEGDDGIEIATIVPQAVDTPIFEHAGNYSGRAMRPIPPIVRADEVAEGIERCAEDPKREVNYGRIGKLLEMTYAFAPGIYRRIAPSAFLRGTLSERSVAPTPGNVEVSTGPYRVDGGWLQSRKPTLKRAFLSAATGALAGLVGASAKRR